MRQLAPLRGRPTSTVAFKPSGIKPWRGSDLLGRRVVIEARTRRTPLTVTIGRVRSCTDDGILTADIYGLDVESIEPVRLRADGCLVAWSEERA